MENFLIIALGNYGARYQDTRHNIAWMLVDNFLSMLGQPAQWKKKFRGEYTQITHRQKKIYILKPQTYMNLSGESARPLADFLKIDKKHMLIVQDELDFPFGMVGFKNGGGLAGHNGLKSISQHFGGNDFMRMRLGIDRPIHGDVSHWVLSNFSKEEGSMLQDYLSRASEALDYFLEHGFERAQNYYNKKNLLS